uniref:Si:dkey-14o18.2 n=1 Tax=Amphilophus citrinellus TaxID=61819 RepID=A0A3Q0R2L7_AMPCI
MQRVGATLGLALQRFPLRSLIFYCSLSCVAAAGSLPGIEYDYGISPKFVCTPIPPEADPSCYSPPSVPHGPSTTILHLRESLVRQKETILDQRETIRELTAKLTLCEGFGGHHDNHHDNHHESHHDNHHDSHHSNHHDDQHGHHASLSFTDLCLQARNSSSSYSSSLRELLQRKISALEEQLHSYYRDHHDYGHHNDHHGDHHDDHHSSGHYDSHHDDHHDNGHHDAFLLDFPMRNNYMYARMKRSVVTEIFALTICLWLKAGAGPGLGTPFSYAVPGQANELVLIEWGSNPMELLINDKAVTLPITMTDGKWHHVCVTWSTGDGVWEAYQDGAKKGSGQNLSAWHPIKPGGIFILGQEQDTMGGRFDVTQSFVGELSDLQFWSRVLTSSEIYSQATCGGHLVGDVMSWSEESVELHGGLTELSFDPCH